LGQHEKKAGFMPGLFLGIVDRCLVAAAVTASAAAVAVIAAAAEADQNDDDDNPATAIISKHKGKSSLICFHPILCPARRKGYLFFRAAASFRLWNNLILPSQYYYWRGTRDYVIIPVHIYNR